ncbi:unnamed protein product [Mytilus coruscus]|uniref:EGF-like domain-containing protein n=1 Tax=Mytilus coruscus TaxID=42192 RepID=A0A6J8E7N2_MYTCO|nr:unnamed protein product [Mytilus coruscus]
MADLKTSCMKELRMNNTLKEPGPEGQPSVASIVKNKICDGNPPCSNNGDCVNGTCSCYDGFISPDCSVDLKIPPELIGVRGDSLCDISEIPCNLSFVIAEEIYNTEKLSCDIVEYQVSANGTYVKMDNHIAVAKHETLVEVLCPLSTGRVKRSASSKDEENFSTAFEISVSYDGVLFSEPVAMLIYDSRCQEVDGFCRLDGQCFMEDEYSTINPCMKCNTKVSQYIWTRVNDIDGCIQIETKNPKEIQTIVLATCIPLVSVLIIAVIVGLIKYKKLKRLKVGNSQDFGNICTTRNSPYKK